MFPQHWKSRIDEWLVSSLAAKLFFVSTLLVLALTTVFQGLVDPAKMPLWMRIYWIILGVLGPLGLSFLCVGMWTYWVRLDNSRAYAKRIWFVVLLVGAWYGECAYYYFVYLPQVIRKRRAQPS